MFFLSGVGLVVWGWAIVGMIVETYGFWCLFAGFIPTALSFLRRIPVFGRVLDVPVFKTVQSRLTASWYICRAAILQAACVGEDAIEGLQWLNPNAVQVLNKIAPAQTLPI